MHTHEYKQFLSMYRVCKQGNYMKVGSSESVLQLQTYAVNYIITS